MIQGRVKRFAKIAGEMISLTTVEQELDRLWPDMHHAVVAVADERKGEKLVLITEHQEANIKEVRTYLRDRGFSDLYVPRELLVVDKVPVLGTGKTDYPTCQEKANEKFAD